MRACAPNSFFFTNFQMLIGGYSHHYDKVGTVLGGHLKNTDGRGFSTEKMKVWHVCRWSVCKRPDAQILGGKKCVPRHSTLSRTFFQQGTASNDTGDWACGQLNVRNVRFCLKPTDAGQVFASCAGDQTVVSDDCVSNPPNITPVPVKIKTWVCTPWSGWLVCAQFAAVAGTTPHARARGLLSAHAAAQSALSPARGMAGEG